MAVKKHPDGKRWVADFYYWDDKGKRRRKEGTKLTRDAATKWAVDEKRRLEALYSHGAKSSAHQRTIPELIAFFKSRGAYKNVEPGTKQTYDRRLEVFRAWTEERGILTLKQFFDPDADRDRYRHAEEYYEYLCETYTGDTPDGFLQLASMAANAEMRRPKKERFWTESPWDSIERKKKDDHEVRWFSREELSALQSEMTTFELHAFDLLLHTGMRKGEAQNLIWPQITKGQISIHAHDGWKPKFGKRRNIPLNDRATECLEYFLSLKGPKYVVWGMESKGLKPVGINFLHNHFQRVKARASKASGLTFEGTSVHTFRATCGSLMLQNGVPIAFVSKFLGHADIQTTQKHYASLCQDNLEFAAKTLNDALRK